MCAEAKCGVVLNPATPIETLSDVLDIVDHVLIMSVNPGFGGQRFIPRSIEKIRQMRALLDRAGSNAELEVDGGITAHNARRVVEAGASVLVAGSAIFDSGDSTAAVKAMRDAVDGVPAR